MKSNCLFYICPTCFYTSESEANGHDHAMIKYDACLYTGDQRKPLMAGNGCLKSQAPRWFLEAVRSHKTVVKVMA